jgi:hypothetical protein
MSIVTRHMSVALKTHAIKESDLKHIVGVISVDYTAPLNGLTHKP